MPKPEYANGRPVRHPSQQQRLARARALGWETSRPGEEPEPQRPRAFRRQGLAAAIAFVVGILIGCIGFVVPYSAYGAPTAIGAIVAFVALVCFCVSRSRGRRLPDCASIWLTLLGIVILVAMVASVSVVREHGATNASGAIEIPATEQPVTDGIYTGTLKGAALQYDARGDYTTLGLALTDLDGWTPQLNATVTASNGQTLHCDMARSHRADNGDTSIEEVPCDGAWDLDQIRLATSLDVTSAR